MALRNYGVMLNSWLGSKKIIDEGVLILDDSVEEKNYTDENEVICWHYSYAKGRHVKGINLLSCLIRYGDISFPVSYEVIKKDIKYCDIETKKEKRKSSVNKNELFRKLVKQAINNDIKFAYVLADKGKSYRINNYKSGGKNLEVI